LDVARIDAHTWAISSRGFNGEFANKLLVLIDGRSVYTPLFSGVFWDVQNPMLEDVDRIEVIRGPGATMWGANAVNGVINIITKSAKDTQGWLVRGGGGNQDRGFGEFRYGGSRGDDLSYRLYGKYLDDADSEMLGGGNGRDGWQQGRGGFRVDWQPSRDNLLTVQGDAYDGTEGQVNSEPTITPPYVQRLTQATDFSGGDEIDSAYQGEEGLERVRQSLQSGRPYAIAIVDVRMPPGWDGIETTQKLWEVDSDLQVVICSAYSDYSWDEIIARLGNSDRLLFLKKPFDTVEILQLANALTEKWRLIHLVRNQIADLEKIVRQRTQQLQVTNESLLAEIAQHRESEERLQHVLEDLRDAQQRVIQQERLRALGGMASGIAHDFNNALVGILGISELLLYHPENLEDKQKTKRYVEMINTSAKDAAEIVNRLREFYRHREGRDVFQMVDLNQLVEDAVSLTQPMWKTQAEAKNISITLQKDLQNIPPVAGDASELREVLTNLIFNAVDAMPRDGTVVIRTRGDDSQVTLEVSDTGTGMTDEVRQRCLEPFFTTKGAHGTGLGLSMVYGIVQRHQGTIDINSEIGKGSTFIIRIPHQTAKPQSVLPSQPVKALQPLHMLLVDDEVMVRKIIGEYLKNDGHTVEVADSGRDALEKFHKGQFDLVVVDRAMPDMNGDQVATAIRSVDPNVPVLMLTGFGAMMKDANEKPAAVDLVVAKPVTIDGLRAAVTEAVGLHTASPRQSSSAHLVEAGV
jgi:signal transduction histidine kinase